MSISIFRCLTSKTPKGDCSPFGLELIQYIAIFQMGDDTVSFVIVHISSWQLAVAYTDVADVRRALAFFVQLAELLAGFQGELAAAQVAQHHRSNGNLHGVILLRWALALLL